MKKFINRYRIWKLWSKIKQNEEFKEFSLIAFLAPKLPNTVTVNKFFHKKYNLLL